MQVSGRSWASSPSTRFRTAPCYSLFGPSPGLPVSDPSPSAPCGRWECAELGAFFAGGFLETRAGSRQIARSRPVVAVAVAGVGGSCVDGDPGGCPATRSRSNLTAHLDRMPLVQASVRRRDPRPQALYSGLCFGLEWSSARPWPPLTPPRGREGHSSPRQSCPRSSPRVPLRSNGVSERGLIFEELSSFVTFRR